MTRNSPAKIIQIHKKLIKNKKNKKTTTTTTISTVHTTLSGNVGL